MGHKGVDDSIVNLRLRAMERIKNRECSGSYEWATGSTCKDKVKTQDADVAFIFPLEPANEVTHLPS